jgi:hypothetical protein
LQIAPRIVTGLWYALLAIVVGSAVVAVGGGGIPVARRYLERLAGRAEQRGPELKQQVQQSARQAEYRADASAYRAAPSETFDDTDPTTRPRRERS